MQRGRELTAGRVFVLNLDRHGGRRDQGNTPKPPQEAGEPVHGGASERRAREHGWRLFAPQHWAHGATPELVIAEQNRQVLRRDVTVDDPSKARSDRPLYALPGGGRGRIRI